MKLRFDNIKRARILDTSALPGIEWAEGLEFGIPEDLLSDESFFCKSPDGYKLVGRRPNPSIGNDLALLCAFTNQKPASSRMPFSYQKIPIFLRTLIGRAFGLRMRRNKNKWASFPGFPLDLSADLLSDMSGCHSPFSGQVAPVILSHDLDTLEGLQNAVHLFLPIEEDVGAVSVNFIVPFGWDIDMTLVEELKGRGHEMGIHGYDHSNLTAYCSGETLHERIKRGKCEFADHTVMGYRAPSLVRTRILLAGLSNFYRYDSSVPTSGGPFPVPNNGCATARPFRIEGIWELPLTMPRDGSLLFLGYSPEKILSIWKKCALEIALSGGLIFLLTHCEKRFSGRSDMLDIYERFLHFLNESDAFYWSTPARVLDLCESI